MSHPTLDSSPKLFDTLPARADSERRQHRRAHPALRCFIASDRYAALVRVHDLSIDGLAVRAPMPFAPGDEVAITLELPEGKSVRVRAVTIWVASGDPARASPRLGVRFLEVLEGSDELSRLCRP